LAFAIQKAVAYAVKQGSAPMKHWATVSIALFMTLSVFAQRKTERSKPVPSQIVAMPGGTFTFDALSVVIDVQGVPGIMALCGSVTNQTQKTWTTIYLDIRWTDSTGMVHTEGDLNFENLHPSERRAVGGGLVNFERQVSVQHCKLLSVDSESAPDPQTVSFRYKLGLYEGQDSNTPPPEFDAKWSAAISDSKN
jgi:hypothetical protein